MEQRTTAPIVPATAVRITVRRSRAVDAALCGHRHLGWRRRQTHARAHAEHCSADRTRS
ncbi:hypothetical protein ACU4GD_41400 [Cupriavidus basilensis]